MKYFTAGWRVGINDEDTELMRQYSTEDMVKHWIKQCYDTLKAEDELFMLGDMVTNLSDLSFLRKIPKCGKNIVPGDTEMDTTRFTFAKFLEAVDLLEDENVFVAPAAFLGIFNEVDIAGVSWRLVHKPMEAIREGEDHVAPALCGGARNWIAQCMPNGQPIINVNIDVWGRLVSENDIQQLYKKSFLDCDIDERVDLWNK